MKCYEKCHWWPILHFTLSDPLVYVDLTLWLKKNKLFITMDLYRSLVLQKMVPSCMLGEVFLSKFILLKHSAGVFNKLRQV